MIGDGDYDSTSHSSDISGDCDTTDTDRGDLGTEDGDERGGGEEGDKEEYNSEGDIAARTNTATYFEYFHYDNILNFGGGMNVASNRQNKKKGKSDNNEHSIMESAAGEEEGQSKERAIKMAKFYQTEVERLSELTASVQAKFKEQQEETGSLLVSLTQLKQEREKLIDEMQRLRLIAFRGGQICRRCGGSNNRHSGGHNHHAVATKKKDMKKQRTINRNQEQKKSFSHSASSGDGDDTTTTPNTSSTTNAAYETGSSSGASGVEREIPLIPLSDRKRIDQCYLALRHNTFGVPAAAGGGGGKDMLRRRTCGDVNVENVATLMPRQQTQQEAVCGTVDHGENVQQHEMPRHHHIESDRNTTTRQVHKGGVGHHDDPHDQQRQQQHELTLSMTHIESVVNGYLSMYERRCWTGERIEETRRQVRNIVSNSHGAGRVSLSHGSNHNYSSSSSRKKRHQHIYVPSDWVLRMTREMYGGVLYPLLSVSGPNQAVSSLTLGPHLRSSPHPQSTAVSEGSGGGEHIRQGQDDDDSHEGKRLVFRTSKRTAKKKQYAENCQYIRNATDTLFQRLIALVCAVDSDDSEHDERKMSNSYNHLKLLESVYGIDPTTSLSFLDPQQVNSATTGLQRDGQRDERARRMMNTPYQVVSRTKSLFRETSTLSFVLSSFRSADGDGGNNSGRHHGGNTSSLSSSSSYEVPGSLFCVDDICAVHLLPTVAPSRTASIVGSTKTSTSHQQSDEGSESTTPGRTGPTTGNEAVAKSDSAVATTTPDRSGGSVQRWARDRYLIYQLEALRRGLFFSDCCFGGYESGSRNPTITLHDAIDIYGDDEDTDDDCGKWVTESDDATTADEHSNSGRSTVSRGGERLAVQLHTSQKTVEEREKEEAPAALTSLLHEYRCVFRHRAVLNAVLDVTSSCGEDSKMTVNNKPSSFFSSGLQTLRPGRRRVFESSSSPSVSSSLSSTAFNPPDAATILAMDTHIATMVKELALMEQEKKQQRNSTERGDLQQQKQHDQPPLQRRGSAFLSSTAVIGGSGDDSQHDDHDVDDQYQYPLLTTVPIVDPCSGLAIPPLFPSSSSSSPSLSSSRRLKEGQTERDGKDHHPGGHLAGGLGRGAVTTTGTEGVPSPILFVAPLSPIRLLHSCGYDVIQRYVLARFFGVAAVEETVEDSNQGIKNSKAPARTGTSAREQREKIEARRLARQEDGDENHDNSNNPESDEAPKKGDERKVGFDATHSEQDKETSRESEKNAMWTVFNKRLFLLWGGVYDGDRSSGHRSRGRYQQAGTGLSSAAGFPTAPRLLSVEYIDYIMLLVLRHLRQQVILSRGVLFGQQQQSKSEHEQQLVREAAVITTMSTDVEDRQRVRDQDSSSGATVAGSGGESINDTMCRLAARSFGPILSTNDRAVRSAKTSDRFLNYKNNNSLVAPLLLHQHQRRWEEQERVRAEEEMRQTIMEKKKNGQQSKFGRVVDAVSSEKISTRDHPNSHPGGGGGGGTRASSMLYSPLDVQHCLFDVLYRLYGDSQALCSADKYNHSTTTTVQPVGSNTNKTQDRNGNDACGVGVSDFYTFSPSAIENIVVMKVAYEILASIDYYAATTTANPLLHVALYKECLTSNCLCPSLLTVLATSMVTVNRYWPAGGGETSPLPPPQPPQHEHEAKHGPTAAEEHRMTPVPDDEVETVLRALFPPHVMRKLLLSTKRKRNYYELQQQRQQQAQMRKAKKNMLQTSYASDHHSDDDNDEGDGDVDEDDSVTSALFSVETMVKDIRGVAFQRIQASWTGQQPPPSSFARPPTSFNATVSMDLERYSSSTSDRQPPPMLQQHKSVITLSDVSVFLTQMVMNGEEPVCHRVLRGLRRAVKLINCAAATTHQSQQRDDDSAEHMDTLMGLGRMVSLQSVLELLQQSCFKTFLSSSDQFHQHDSNVADQIGSAVRDSVSSAAASRISEDVGWVGGALLSDSDVILNLQSMFASLFYDQTETNVMFNLRYGEGCNSVADELQPSPANKKAAVMKMKLRVLTTGKSGASNEGEEGEAQGRHGDDVRTEAETTLAMTDATAGHNVEDENGCMASELQRAKLNSLLQHQQVMREPWWAIFLRSLFRYSHRVYNNKIGCESRMNGERNQVGDTGAEPSDEHSTIERSNVCHVIDDKDVIVPVEIAAQIISELIWLQLRTLSS